MPLDTIIKAFDLERFFFVSIILNAILIIVNIRVTTIIIA